MNLVESTLMGGVKKVQALAYQEDAIISPVIRQCMLGGNNDASCMVVIHLLGGHLLAGGTLHSADRSSQRGASKQQAQCDEHRGGGAVQANLCKNIRRISQ